MIIGHERIVSDLRRSADRKRLAHSYVFFGPQRVGKRQVALGLANYLETGAFSVLKAARPLGDTLAIAPDTEGTIGIDHIREIKRFLWQKPNRSAYRTVIIEEAEFLTTEAQNALLKITEEPPSSALVLLVIDDPERLLTTLRSRLRAIHFSTVPLFRISRWLTESFGCASEAAARAANQSFGKPGLAWAMLYDEEFKKLQGAARTFLGTRGVEFRDFIKDLVAAADFNFDAFLEALLLQLLPLQKKHLELWRRILALRRQINYFNLNPRLQLTALAEALN